MSSFMCEKCRTIISDSPTGYTTECEHYPLDRTAAAVRPTDYPEDFRFENGNYWHQCRVCGEDFTGHKRRIWCNVCQATEQTEPAATEGFDRTASHSKGEYVGYPVEIPRTGAAMKLGGHEVIYLARQLERENAALRVELDRANRANEDRYFGLKDEIAALKRGK